MEDEVIKGFFKSSWAESLRSLSQTVVNLTTETVVPKYCFLCFLSVIFLPDFSVCCIKDRIFYLWFSAP